MFPLPPTTFTPFKNVLAPIKSDKHPTDFHPVTEEITADGEESDMTDEDNVTRGIDVDVALRL
jgi:hypothetical protein